MRIKSFVLLLIAFPQASISQAAVDSPPNIILLLVEDLSPHIKSFGDDVALTPNLDALASEGVRFTSVFTPAPVCAPSRAALFTGLYPQSFGAQHMRTTHDAVPPANVKAFPEILRANGYFTINQGKTDYQFGDPTSMWDVNKPNASLEDRDPNKPFFAVLQNAATHESRLFRESPWVWLKRYVKTEFRCRPCASAMLRKFDPEAVEVPTFLPDTPKVRDEITRLYTNIFAMDAWVGRVVDELRIAGLLENTIIIWTTDHGDGLPRAKRSLYDSGVRVPMIIRFPDKAGMGSEDNDLISFVDMPAMILHLANVELPSYLRRGDLNTHGFPYRDYVYGGIDRMDELQYRSRMVRSREFKYIKNFDLQNPILGLIGYRERLDSMSEFRRLKEAGELPPVIEKYLDAPLPPEELYDIRSDRFETNNLATEPQYRDILEHYRLALAAWLDETQDLSRMPEQEMFHFLWNGDAQPRTIPPTFMYSGSVEAPMLSIHCDTEGSSIEYRFPLEKYSNWKLYTAPIDLNGESQVEARAIRYGFVPSEITRETLPRVRAH